MVAPERRDQLVARGIEYGKSRSICNVHWLSDVQASQIIGSAAVAQLHTDPCSEPIYVRQHWK